MKKFLLMLCLCMPLCIQAQKSKKIELNIVYIGNSITQGVLLQNPQEEAPPVRTTLWLKGQEGIAEVHMSNQGVSGMTTVDFLPDPDIYFIAFEFPEFSHAMARHFTILDPFINRFPRHTEIFGYFFHREPAFFHHFRTFKDKKPQQYILSHNLLWFSCVYKSQKVVFIKKT